MKIVKYRLLGLWNSEYPLVASRIIDTIEEHKPRTIHLGTSFDRLAAFRPQLEKIKVQENHSSESAALSELDQQRDTLYNVIYTTAKAFQRTPIGETSNKAHQIVTLLKRHGSNISATNYTAETKRLYDLAAEINDKPEIRAALEELSLLSFFEKMSELNQQFDALFMERSKKMARAEKVNVSEIRSECDKAITQMWTAIEFCMLEYGVEKYAALVNDLNALNTYYKQKLAARAARRKAKQDVSKEEPIEEPTELGIRV